MMSLQAVQFNSVQSLNHVQLFVTPWISANTMYKEMAGWWEVKRKENIPSIPYLPFAYESYLSTVF